MSEIVYITRFNHERIFFKLKKLKIPYDPIAKIMEERYPFLNRSNAHYLSIILQFLKDPRKFISKYYHQWTDTKRFLFEHQPSFHAIEACEFLHNSFEGIKMPHKLKSPIDYTYSLREWEKKLPVEVRANTNATIDSCIVYFSKAPYFLNLSKSDFEIISKANSGVKEYINYDLSEIIKKIQCLVTDAMRFYNEPTNKIIVGSLKNYKKESDNYPRPLNIAAEKVESSMIQLKKINQEFKELVIEYFMKRFNPDNSFDSNILKDLNFKPCKRCFEERLHFENYSLIPVNTQQEFVPGNEEIEININEDMPF